MTEPPQAAEVPDLLQATEPREQLEATEASAGVSAAEPWQEPSGGCGCAVGYSDSTDLSAVMFGGAMLTGLGLILVRNAGSRGSNRKPRHGRAGEKVMGLLGWKGIKTAMALIAGVLLLAAGVSMVQAQGLPASEEP